MILADTLLRVEFGRSSVFLQPLETCLSTRIRSQSRDLVEFSSTFRYRCKGYSLYPQLVWTKEYSRTFCAFSEVRVLWPCWLLFFSSVWLLQQWFHHDWTSCWCRTWLFRPVWLCYLRSLAWTCFCRRRDSPSTWCSHLSSARLLLVLCPVLELRNDSSGSSLSLLSCCLCGNACLRYQWNYMQRIVERISHVVSPCECSLWYWGLWFCWRDLRWRVESRLRVDGEQFHDSDPASELLFLLSWAFPRLGSWLGYWGSSSYHSLRHSPLWVCPTSFRAVLWPSDVRYQSVCELRSWTRCTSSK